jgi:drug/metabolite transporter (DMT)-like permease
MCKNITAFLLPVFLQIVMTTNKKNTQAHITLLLTNLFFAVNLSAVKHFTNGQLVKPFGINVIGVGASVILFWLLYIFKPTYLFIEKKDRWRLIWCALTGIAINQLLFLKGLSLTYPVHASLLMLTTPILIVLVSGWLLKQKTGLKKIIGLVSGVSGAALLILFNTNGTEKRNIIFGDLLILINAASYTIYFIIVKPLMNKYDTLIIIRWIFTAGFLMVLPFGWTEFAEINWQQFGLTEIILMTTVAVAGTFLAYLFNIYGIKVLGASAAGFYIYTQPFFATFISMTFLGEGLQSYKILAAILIFTGVYLANKE